MKGLVLSSSCLPTLSAAIQEVCTPSLNDHDLVWLLPDRNVPPSQLFVSRVTLYSVISRMPSFMCLMRG